LLPGLHVGGLGGLQGGLLGGLLPAKENPATARVTTHAVMKFLILKTFLLSLEAFYGNNSNCGRLLNIHRLYAFYVIENKKDKGHIPN